MESLNYSSISTQSSILSVSSQSFTKQTDNSIEYQKQMHEQKLILQELKQKINPISCMKEFCDYEKLQLEYETTTEKNQCNCKIIIGNQILAQSIKKNQKLAKQEVSENAILSLLENIHFKKFLGKFNLKSLQIKDNIKEEDKIKELLNLLETKFVSESVAILKEVHDKFQNKQLEYQISQFSQWSFNCQVHSNIEKNSLVIIGEGQGNSKSQAKQLAAKNSIAYLIKSNYNLALNIDKIFQLKQKLKICAKAQYQETSRIITQSLQTLNNSQNVINVLGSLSSPQTEQYNNVKEMLEYLTKKQLIIEKMEESTNNSSSNFILFLNNCKQNYQEKIQILKKIFCEKFRNYIQIITKQKEEQYYWRIIDKENPLCKTRILICQSKNSKSNK